MSRNPRQTKEARIGVSPASTGMDPPVPDVNTMVNTIPREIASSRPPMFPLRQSGEGLPLPSTVRSSKRAATRNRSQIPTSTCRTPPTTRPPARERSSKRTSVFPLLSSRTYPPESPTVCSSQHPRVRYTSKVRTTLTTSRPPARTEELGCNTQSPAERRTLLFNRKSSLVDQCRTNGSLVYKDVLPFIYANSGRTPLGAVSAPSKVERPNKRQEAASKANSNSPSKLESGQRKTSPPSQSSLLRPHKTDIRSPKGEKHIATKIKGPDSRHISSKDSAQSTMVKTGNRSNPQIQSNVPRSKTDVNDPQIGEKHSTGKVQGLGKGTISHIVKIPLRKKETYYIATGLQCPVITQQPALKPMKSGGVCLSPIKAHKSGGVCLPPIKAHHQTAEEQKEVIKVAQFPTTATGVCKTTRTSQIDNWIKSQTKAGKKETICVSVRHDNSSTTAYEDSQMFSSTNGITESERNLGKVGRVPMTTGRAARDQGVHGGSNKEIPNYARNPIDKPSAVSKLPPRADRYERTLYVKERTVARKVPRLKVTLKDTPEPRKPWKKRDAKTAAQEQRREQTRYYPVKNSSDVTFTQHELEYFRRQYRQQRTTLLRILNFSPPPKNSVDCKDRVEKWIKDQQHILRSTGYETTDPDLMF